MKYDVFISYSRKDYVDNQGNVMEDSPVNRIIQFLDKKNISYWVDKEGIYSGREFVEVLANAIVDSKMVIFVSSKNSNSSIYTTGEVFEAIENKRLIIPVKIDNSQYNPKFKLLLRPLDFIDYSKVDALSDLLRAIEKEKEIINQKEEEEKRKLKELEEQKNLAAIKNEIKECAGEVQKLMTTRQMLLSSIYKKLQAINIVEKECPVCKSKCQIETEYCQTCGWYFPALSNVEWLDVPVDKSALTMARTKWENAYDQSEGQQTIVALQAENANLKETQVQLNRKRQKTLEDIASLERERKEMASEINILQEKNYALTREYTILFEEKDAKIAEVQKICEELKTDNYLLKVKIDNMRCLNEDLEREKFELQAQIAALNESQAKLEDSEANNMANPLKKSNEKKATQKEELSFVSSFKDCFDKHHPLTSVMLCLAIVGCAIAALVSLRIYIGRPQYHDESLLFALYMLDMSFVNYLIFKFNKWIWIVAVVLCPPNAVLFALLFLLKKNGKNSYYYLKNNT